MKKSYRQHHASRYEFPTKVVMGSGAGGVLVIGHKGARVDIESKLGRKLNEPVSVRKHAGEWIFREALKSQ